MISPVIVVRPEPGCSATVGAGQALGLDARGFPLFEVRPRAWEPPPAQAIDALLLGSANAVRHAGEGLTPLRRKPAYAVGEATAEAARKAGLTIALTGQGRLQAMIDALPGPLRLLRLAGEDHVPLTPASGVRMETRIVYAAEPLAMSIELAGTLRAGAVVLLHSAAAAQHFAAECDRLCLSRQSLFLAALGPRIAAAAGAGWGALRSAPVPGDGALLALAADLCHDSDGAKEL